MRRADELGQEAMAATPDALYAPVEIPVEALQHGAQRRQKSLRFLNLIWPAAQPWRYEIYTAPTMLRFFMLPKTGDTVRKL